MVFYSASDEELGQSDSYIVEKLILHIKHTLMDALAARCGSAVYPGSS
jgi:hypothetical protein